MICPANLLANAIRVNTKGSPKEFGKTPEPHTKRFGIFVAKLESTTLIMLFIPPE